MIKIYVAGAYSADNVIDVLRNIGRGQEAAAELFRLGFAPFCPWLDKEFVIHNWRDNQDDKMFKEYSMEWLRVCDGVMIVPNHIGDDPISPEQGGDG